MKSIRVFALALLAAGILGSAGCFTNPVTGRQALSLVSAEQEMQLGLASWQELKQQEPVNRDPALNAQLQKVGKRLAAVASKDMPNAQWEFVLFEGKDANAFCLPGGKVGVYTGILPITKNEAGLATVLGHEIAHAISHHAAERISQAQALQAGGAIIGAASASAKPLTQEMISAAYGIGGPLLVQLPHSRKQESEADHIGIIYMARAGYNPREAIEFWRRFAAAHGREGSGTPEFLRTHPLDETRIRQLQQWMPEAERQMRRADAPISDPAGSEIISRPLR